MFSPEPLGRATIFFFCIPLLCSYSNLLLQPLSLPFPFLCPVALREAALGRLPLLPKELPLEGEEKLALRFIHIQPPAVPSARL